MVSKDNLVEVTKLRKEFGGLVATDDVHHVLDAPQHRSHRIRAVSSEAGREAAPDDVQPLPVIYFWAIGLALLILSLILLILLVSRRSRNHDV